jgi:hypothetical protein
VQDHQLTSGTQRMSIDDKMKHSLEETQSYSSELPTVFTIEQILASKMHKARYQCKMNL